MHLSGVRGTASPPRSEGDAPRADDARGLWLLACTLRPLPDDLLALLMEAGAVGAAVAAALGEGRRRLRRTSQNAKRERGDRSSEGEFRDHGSLPMDLSEGANRHRRDDPRAGGRPPAVMGITQMRFCGPRPRWSASAQRSRHGKVPPAPKVRPAAGPCRRPGRASRQTPRSPEKSRFVTGFSFRPRLPYNSPPCPRPRAPEPRPLSRFELDIDGHVGLRETIGLKDGRGWRSPIPRCRRPCARARAMGANVGQAGRKRKARYNRDFSGLLGVLAGLARPGRRQGPAAGRNLGARAELCRGGPWALADHLGRPGRRKPHLR